MVSVIAANIKNRREYRTLCELFDKVDTSGDGRVDLEEFTKACKVYGIALSTEDVDGFKSIASSNGEVCDQNIETLHSSLIPPLISIIFLVDQNRLYQPFKVIKSPKTVLQRVQ